MLTIAGIRLLNSYCLSEDQVQLGWGKRHYHPSCAKQSSCMGCWELTTHADGKELLALALQRT